MALEFLGGRGGVLVSLHYSVLISWSMYGARGYWLRFIVAMGDEDLDAPHPLCNPHDPLSCTSLQLFPQAAPSQLPLPPPLPQAS